MSVLVPYGSDVIVYPSKSHRASGGFPALGSYPRHHIPCKSCMAGLIQSNMTFKCQGLRAANNRIYPQDWIIGVDGTVVHVNTVYEPEEMKAILEIELAKIE